MESSRFPLRIEPLIESGAEWCCSGEINGGLNTSPPQTFNININPAGNFVSFSAPTLLTTESSGFTTITVKRVGDTSLPVTVDYATSGNSGVPCSTVIGMASPKCDFTEAFGTLSFAGGQDTKTFRVLITQDSYVEGSEDLTLTLSNATGFAALTAPLAATLTINDDVTEPSTTRLTTR
ncbi:MAG: hypothetical protein JWM21_4918 [Acidobacteria bacterium]|nr:hypothetical protein [Acidobacteriota bacterium]